MAPHYHKGYVFTAACIGMLLFGIVMISLGSILPEVVEKYQLSEVKTGSLLTLLPAGILVGSLVFGPLIDWLSYKRILISGSLMTLLGIEGIVLSEVMIILYLSVFCIGLGGGVLNGLTNALVSEISDEDHSANLSLLGVFFGVGALGTPVILGLLKGVYSFEVIFGWLGAFIVVPVLFFLLILFPKSGETKGIPFREALKMSKDPMLLLFGFILFFQSGIEGLTNNWTTLYLEEVKEMEADDALFILSSFVGALTVTRIILSKLLRIINPYLVVITSFVIALAGSVLILYGSGNILLIIGIAGLGVGLAAGFPVILGYVGQLYTHLSATAFSMVMTIALVGNVIANYMMGLMSQHFGIDVLPYFVTAFILMVLFLLSVTKKKYYAQLF